MPDYTARRTMMVDTQVRPSDVTKFPIIEAMLTIARENFVPSSKREAAYVGENITFAPGRVVLEPRTLAKMLDALNITGDELVLDIGCGLGYSSAVIARIAQAVVAVEADEALVGEAQAALTQASADNVILEQGPLAGGAAQHGPYDAILIEGGVEEVPAAILDQLKDGGRIACIFVDGSLGTVRIGYKLDGGMSWRMSFNAAAPVLAGFEKTTAFAL
ncbi:Protein-L-isoaspartate O-methyltransferase [Aquimixticola soesokkakensis]|uniref:Protein-L-isoaspartate O-methyltransferase n=1 Tax=Aquimixticola soesokkakensis TaxID=1519096 RepID=A0A1Y5SCX7_9RHOB|nr:protein-L-isoaspartate O-methyltransferase [Aquimixticola soesokkakensis]SLN37860.1 Protein-L-isoaspartate O-methyltransferase [Aquimixticola soesokkakensis]